jgi:hypothetical protein
VIGHAPTVAEEEKVIAYVVKKDAELTAEQVMAHVAAHVAVYKQVRMRVLVGPVGVNLNENQMNLVF